MIYSCLSPSLLGTTHCHIALESGLDGPNTLYPIFSQLSTLDAWRLLLGACRLRPEGRQQTKGSGSVSLKHLTAHQASWPPLLLIPGPLCWLAPVRCPLTFSTTSSGQIADQGSVLAVESGFAVMLHNQKLIRDSYYYASYLRRHILYIT